MCAAQETDPTCGTAPTTHMTVAMGKTWAICSGGPPRDSAYYIAQGRIMIAMTSLPLQTDLSIRKVETMECFDQLILLLSQLQFTSL